MRDCCNCGKEGAEECEVYLGFSSQDHSEKVVLYPRLCDACINLVDAGEFLDSDALYRIVRSEVENCGDGQRVGIKTVSGKPGFAYAGTNEGVPYVGVFSER